LNPAIEGFGALRRCRGGELQFTNHETAGERAVPVMIKVLIADDHAVVRKGIRQILEETSDIVVGGEASNGEEVLRQIRAQSWDALVLDITMPGQSGLEVLRQARHEHPELPILVLSMHSQEQYAARVLKAGASGYLPKESAAEELVEAVRKVCSGGTYVSVDQAEKLIYLSDHDAETPRHALLSNREFEVLRLIASGQTVSEIATQLRLSVKTVSTYRARILEKMLMKTNAALTTYAVRIGLVE
jgi:two-component system invasion response regulator UvrY